MLISVSASAQFKIVPRGSIDYYPRYAIKVKESPSSRGQAYYFSPISTQVGAELEYKKYASIYMHQVLFMDFNSIAKYQPTLGEWFVGVKLHPIDKVTISVEHVCIHPIRTDTPNDRKCLYGGYNKISVSYNM